MASSDALPDSLKDLISRLVPSLEALEVLLLLKREPGRSFSIAEIVAELGISEKAAIAQVERWSSIGMLSGAAASPPVYRFQPATQELQDAAAQIAQAYGNRRISVINFIAARSLERIRQFADAFAFRKENKDG